MRVWLDGQCFQTASRMRGIGRYSLELVRAFAEACPDVELQVSFNAQMPLEAIAARSSLDHFVKPGNIHVWHGMATGGEVEQGWTPQRRASEIALVHHVNCLAPDVALTLNAFEGQVDLAVPLLATEQLAMPAAAVFYDAIPWRYRQHFLADSRARRYYERRLAACGRFDLLLCISEFTRTEAQDLLPGTRAHNISAGVSTDFLARLDREPTGPEPGEPPFVLYVGGMDWHKNVQLIPQAMRRLPPELREKLAFVAAGDSVPALQQALRQQWLAAGLQGEQLRILGHISDDALIDLYRRAALLVHPSRMEGFGLTALEAVVCGTPVAVSRAGALPEIVDDERLRFDPASADELAACIVYALGQPQVRAETAKRGGTLATTFTWKRSAVAAATALAALVAERQPHVPALAELRRRAAAAVRAPGRPPAGTAECLALSEPAAAGPSRLLLEATTSILTPTHSGIQRVVRQICAAATAANPARPTQALICYCDGNDGWFRASAAHHHAFDKDGAEPLRPAAPDRLVMLDSSWNLYANQRRRLVEARLCGVEVVFCVYDLVPLNMPGFCAEGMSHVFGQWFRSALELATGFVCISRAVADELHHLLETLAFPRPVRIGYWRLGADFLPPGPARRETGSEAQRARSRPMFLVVGTLEPRKGHRVVLEAFEAGWQSGLDADLVLVGKPGWSTAVLAERIRRHPEQGRRLFWHEAADDRQLLDLYRRCDALIAASWGEGFGLPIVEAGHFGKHVLVSDIPVFREVAAGAAGATFFEVGSASGLLAAVRTFLATLRPGQPADPLRGDHADDIAGTAWPGWDESARELCDVVLGDRWYRTYQPPTLQPFAGPADIGGIYARAPLTDAGRRHEIVVVDRSGEIDEHGRLRLLVKITNRSDEVWHGLGDGSGRLAVGLGHHILDADGAMLDFDCPRTYIPLVLGPGDSHYTSVAIAPEWLDGRAAFVELELMQEGVAWFGRPVRVELAHGG